ncbi:MAG: hypothetical protein K2K29_03960 [Muribaculaceae bacterium]|nr:hypothetical protein [Muribaculaceae bacterium]
MEFERVDTLDDGECRVRLGLYNGVYLIELTNHVLRRASATSHHYCNDKEHRQCQSYIFFDDMIHNYFLLQSIVRHYAFTSIRIYLFD